MWYERRDHKIGNKKLWNNGISKIELTAKGTKKQIYKDPKIVKGFYRFYDEQYQLVEAIQQEIVYGKPYEKLFIGQLIEWF